MSIHFTETEVERDYIFFVAWTANQWVFPEFFWETCATAARARRDYHQALLRLTAGEYQPLGAVRRLKEQYLACLDSVVEEAAVNHCIRF